MRRIYILIFNCVLLAVLPACSDSSDSNGSNDSSASSNMAFSNDPGNPNNYISSNSANNSTGASSSDNISSIASSQESDVKETNQGLRPDEMEASYEPKPKLKPKNSNLLIDGDNVSSDISITYKTIEWTDLIPKGDLDALLNPPKYITDIEDGSLEDQISNQMTNKIADANSDAYQQALSSTRVLEEMDGKFLRIPGFIVPLDFDDNQTITEFFLVPFFGACIHVPPPPPNQIIYVKYPKGVKVDALYDPFWISGILHTSLVENDTATSAYTMTMHAFEKYEY